jgi:hypothetical protein
MRYRLMATYRGVPYEAGIGPTDEDVVLFAACPPPEELGFEPATGHWRKQLRIGDVQGLWESRPLGTFRGDRCIVLDDLGDRLHIAYEGHDAYRAEQLGYWEVDRGVFELITPREEVVEIVEERLDYPRRVAGQAPRSGMTGPMPAVPGPGAPHQTGPQPAVPGPGAPHLSGPQPAVPPHLTGPQRAVPPHLTGPQRAVPPHLTRPQRAVPPHLAGPQPAAARFSAPQPAMTQVTGPQPAVPPHLTGPQPAVPGAAGNGAAPPAPDLAVIPPASEPPLPLEAAARRAAAARVLRPGPVAETAPQPVVSTQPQFTVGPQPQPAVGPQPQPSPARPEPAAGPGPGSSRRRRASASRRNSTQRIFSELAGLAAIPPSAYAVGEEVDGAMCLIQTPDGYEVFNAAAGARHEVRIFDDEESAYFYLFGVLAAEAVRTGRLAPQG